MRSSIIKRTFLFCLTCLCVSSVCTSLTWLFLFLCKAEGETLILLIWIALSSALIFCAYRLEAEKIQRHFIPHLVVFLKIFGLAITAAGAVVVLLQLGAAQRSFAEAWFEFARENGPYGFFAFFAAEIYALLLLISVFAFARKQYVKGGCTILAVTSLCVGIIWGRQLFLVITAVLIIIPFIGQKKWQSFVAPLLFTLAIAALISLIEVRKNKNITTNLYIDTSSLVAKVAPDFPLLSSVPGYGYDVGTAKMATSISLSTHRVLQLTGTPLETVYLTTSRSSLWNGRNWYPCLRGEDEAEVQLLYGEESTDSNKEAMTPLSIYVLEDFYSIVPCTRDTVAVHLPETLRDADVTERVEKVLLVDKGVPKGTRFTLYREKIAENEENLPQSFMKTLNMAIIPPKISELGRTLMRQAEQSGGNEVVVRRQFIQLVLNYLSDGFTYSLKTPQKEGAGDSFEYFLFESKTGFCTWFAGSFTLLLQSQGIPCRLAEGFRITLDEVGQGTVSGVQAHAWPEVFIDGAWRIFEPTPVFSSDDPFSYVHDSDTKTIKQLSRLFNLEPVVEDKGDDVAHLTFEQLLPICLVAFLVIVLALIIFAIYQVRYGSHFLHKLRKTVRQYHKKGVPLPSDTGWLSWQYTLRSSAKTSSEKQKADIACNLAEKMIEETYNKGK